MDHSLILSRCFWQLTSEMQTERSLLPTGPGNPAFTVLPPVLPSGESSSGPRGAAARCWADRRDVAAPMKTKSRRRVM